jgi:CRISPR-associated protein Cas1
LSLADNQIVVTQDKEQTRIPIEDTAWVVIDTHQVTLSTALISACMDAGIAMVITDVTHLPNGIILPFHSHHLQGDVAELQASLSLPLKKRLWQSLVRMKIENQAAVLARCGIDNRPILAMIPLVVSGDLGNTEARAARAYWQRVFVDFTRANSGDKRNALLNYGYAIVRSAVARALVAVGLIPAFGLNHASVANAFNLADDAVEPFRPFVDWEVWCLTQKGAINEGQVSIAERRALASILTRETGFGPETVSVLTATERTAESLVRGMRANNAALLNLPQMRS